MLEQTIKHDKILYDNKYLKLELNQDKCQTFMDKLRDMKYTVEIKEHRNKRSLNSNSYHWLLCQKIADVLGVNNETVHFEMLVKYGFSDKMKILKSAIPRLQQSYTYITIEKEYEEKGYEWAIIKIHHRSMHFNTKEMSKLIKGTVEDAQDLGIDTMTQSEINEMNSLWEVVNETITTTTNR